MDDIRVCDDKNFKMWWDRCISDAYVISQEVKDNSSNPHLSVGQHSFNFSVTIPDRDLPSSFENKYGAVRYWATAYIDREDQSEICSKTFTVLQQIDINQRKYQVLSKKPEIEITTKVSNDAEKTTCCCCFRPDVLSLAASLDRTGYCPGESIAINCRGRNKARKDMGGLKARLIQKIIYNADHKVFKRQENIVSAIGGYKIERGRTKIWENQLLKVPAVPPTINTCEDIAVLYKVQLTMDVPNGVDLQINLPITIGTIPLQYMQESRVKVKMKKCTEGVNCFNQSSKAYHFPLHGFIPSTAFVEDFTFIPKPHAFTQVTEQKTRCKSQEKGTSQDVDVKNQSKQDEKQSLLSPYT